MRAVDGARVLDPPSSLRAARMALEWPDLVEAKRGTDVTAEIAKVIVGGGWALLRLQPASLTLEQVYIQLTEDDSNART